MKSVESLLVRKCSEKMCNTRSPTRLSKYRIQTYIEDSINCNVTNHWQILTNYNYKYELYNCSPNNAILSLSHKNDAVIC